MKRVAKYSAYASIVILFTIYGYFVGAKKIFPFPQLLAVKHYVEFKTGHFETQEKRKSPSNVNQDNTFLERLLIKKIQIPNFPGHGGAFTSADSILLVLTNKGKVEAYDLNKFSPIENDISDVPMNFASLIESGEPYHNGFKILWFRVNGVYVESTKQNTFDLFVSHNSYEPDLNCITQNISKTSFTHIGKQIKQLDDWKTIFTAHPCIDPSPEKLISTNLYPGHISGGLMINYDKTHLLVALGDYNRNGIDHTVSYAMDPSNPYGKYILVDKRTGSWSIYAIGTRNVSGLFRDNNSNIWSVENGPQGGDELNLVLRGKNYGWPDVSYGLWYDPSLKLPGNVQPGRHPEYTQPVFSWVPSVAPRGLIKIEGNRFPYWKGDLIMGTMRDQSLHRMRLDSSNRVVYDERIPLGHRVRDMIILSSGQIAILTDDGYLMIIDDGGAVFEPMNTEDKNRLTVLDKYDDLVRTDNISASPNAVNAHMIFEQNCATCHNLDTLNQVGPNLDNLFQRKVGEAQNFLYSSSLAEDSRKWDSQLLRKFLTNPSGIFPDTRMQRIPLSSAEIDSLVVLFKNQEIGSKLHSQ